MSPSAIISQSSKSILLFERSTWIKDLLAANASFQSSPNLTAKEELSFLGLDTFGLAFDFLASSAAASSSARFLASSGY